MWYFVYCHIYLNTQLYIYVVYDQKLNKETINNNMNNKLWNA